MKDLLRMLGAPAGVPRRRRWNIRRPRPVPSLLLGLLALSLVAFAGAGCACAWWVLAGGAHAAPVYTLATLRARLDREPGVWLRRTVRVRAIPVLDWCFVWSVPSPSCRLREPALVSAEADAAAPLPLAFGAAPPLLAYLRQVPLLGRVALAPQAIHWAKPGIYRVQLQTTSCFLPATSPCIEALVLDSSS